MKLDSKTLVFIGVFFYAIFLFSLIPSAKMMEKRANDARLSIDTLSGNLWQGTASVHVLGAAAAQWKNTQVSWKLNPWSLFSGGFGFDVELKNPNFILHGRVVAGICRVVVSHLNGSISGSWLSDWIPHQRLAFNHDIQLRALFVDVNYRTRQVRFAKGNLTWPGGLFKYSAGMNGQSVMLPPLVGELDTAQGVLQMNIKDLVHQGKLITIQLSGAGQSRIIVFNRLQQFVDGFNTKASGDEAYLTLEQKLF